jgi:hypothetical protein
LENQLQPGIDDMIIELSKKGYKNNKNLMYIIDKGAEHNEAAWAKRFPKAILYIVQSKS